MQSKDTLFKMICFRLNSIIIPLLICGFYVVSFAQQCPDSLKIINGLELQDLGKNYVPRLSKVPEYLSARISNTGGNTSVRRNDVENLVWKDEGYYQRNRELGQTFNVPADTFIILDAIILRTGNGDKAVLPGTAGVPVQMQIFEVIGDPLINDNGTPQGTSSTHGFSTNHRTDDFLEGITYQSIALVRGGVFPDIPATTQNGGEAGHLRYIRWDLKGDAELKLDGGKRYAFMVGLGENGKGFGFTLGNDNQAGSSAAPVMRMDPNGIPWWGIRREGDGTLPPTQIPGQFPPSNEVIRQDLVKESLFDSSYYCSLSPTTDGFPDVDTYRTLEFYIEVQNGCLPAGIPCDDGDSTTVNDLTDGFCNCFGIVEGGCRSNGLIQYARYDDEFTSTPSTGSLKSNSKYPASPDQVLELHEFEAPSNVGDRYGCRISGYLCPPMSGFYRFFISGDDHVELNLSQDASMSDLQRVAYHEGASKPREWDKYPSQRSQPRYLYAGKSIYIEALMKEDSGNDHLSVAWELPNGHFQAPIPGQFLSSQIECPPEGTPCNDFNENTINDIEDGSCSCVGESICPAAGTTCDDQLPFTSDDREDGNCHCQGKLMTSPGLSVTAIGKVYTPDSAVPEYFSFNEADLSGSTSIRNIDRENLRWKPDGYFQRNRDIGQIFTVPDDTSFVLDAIVLRTGNSSSAVKRGAIGAPVYLQIFIVEGMPEINNNGTPTGTNSTHGFTSNHRADDFIEGVTYQSILVASGGFFPAIGPTTKNGGELAHLHYLRWDLLDSNEIVLEGGRRYAFMVGFSGAASERAFTLANHNRAADPNPAMLPDDSNHEAWWSIRREGDGTIPPSQFPGDDPPLSNEYLELLYKESLFEFGHEFSLSPTTDGYPDVDTYRTLEFYIEVKDQVITATDGGYITELHLFPNPTSGQTWISLPNISSGEDFEVLISDINGCICKNFQLEVSGNDHPLLIELDDELARGLYFISIKNDNKLYRGKIVLN